MARLVRVGDIEVPEDLDLERRGYRVRAVAAVLGALLLLAALLGVVGGKGPLAEVDVTTGSGAIQLTFHRFLRYSSPDELDVRFERSAGGRRASGSRTTTWTRWKCRARARSPQA